MTNYLEWSFKTIKCEVVEKLGRYTITKEWYKEVDENGKEHGHAWVLYVAYDPNGWSVFTSKRIGEVRRFIR